jgi:peptidyl-prolyl cis-trans isomerase SurA
VKARHILIRPRLDSLDLVRARAVADTVAELWRAGASADSLAARYHDPAEERGLLEPYDRTQLPASYQAAIEGKQPGEIVPPFAIANRANDSQKYVVLQLVTAAEGGEYTVQDVRDRIRTSLSQERAIRRLLDSLRRDSYVAIRI